MTLIDFNASLDRWHGKQFAFMGFARARRIVSAEQSVHKAGPTLKEKGETAAKPLMSFLLGH